MKFRKNFITITVVSEKYKSFVNKSINPLIIDLVKKDINILI